MAIEHDRWPVIAAQDAADDVPMSVGVDLIESEPLEMFDKAVAPRTSGVWDRTPMVSSA